MRLLHGAITSLLIVTLAGGAQACAAICGRMGTPPTNAMVGVETAPSKSSCHRCVSVTARPSSGQAATHLQSNAAGAESKTPAPCSHCERSNFDGIAAERLGNLDLGLNLDWAAPTIGAALAGDVKLNQTEMAWEVGLPAPPGELLHQFCILVI